MSGTTCKRNRPTMAETPTQVIADSDHHNSKCYMWVHRSGEFYTRRPIVIYEYQISNGLRMNYSNIKIVKFDDEQEKYYLLAKIDDKKIICGDKNTINDSSKLITIDVEDILNKTYYMVSEKNGITLTSKND